MAEVKIIYWSGTGNTAAMAQSVADGVTAAGAEAKIIPVENAGAADIADVKAFALGCPSMGAEQLEESSMEPFVEEILGMQMHRQLVRQQEKNSQQMHKAYPPHLCRLYLAGINGDFYDLTAVFREWSREWFRAFQRIVLAFPWKLGYDRQRFSMRYT